MTGTLFVTQTVALTMAQTQAMARSMSLYISGIRPFVLTRSFSQKSFFWINQTKFLDGLLSGFRPFPSVCRQKVGNISQREPLLEKCPQKPNASIFWATFWTKWSERAIFTVLGSEMDETGRKMDENREKMDGN